MRKVSRRGGVNWLDLYILGSILVYVLIGLHEGFVRTGIGFAASVAGLLCGLWFYRSMGFLLRPYVSSKPAANGVGFLLVFCGVMALGALALHLIRRHYPSKRPLWPDRLLGGAFGVVRGALNATVTVLLLLAFWPHLFSVSVRQSIFAPYFTRAAQVVADAAPDEIRDGFRAARRDIEASPLPDSVKEGVGRLE